MLKHKRKPDVNQMIKYARTTKQEVSTCYKRLKKEPMFQQVETRIMPADIVVAKSQQLGLQPEVKRAAELIAKNFTEHCIEEGKKPATIAGVCFFMAIMKVKGRPSDTEPIWR